MIIDATVVDLKQDNARSCQIEYPCSGPPFHRPRTDPCRLKLTLADSRMFEAVDHDFFCCLRSIRLGLEKYGLRVLVQGARRDVWSTRMQRDMGVGLKGFVLNCEGRRVEYADEVGIFSPADLRDIASVAEQQDFAREWFRKWVAKPRTPEELRSFAECWSVSPTFPKETPPANASSDLEVS